MDDMDYMRPVYLRQKELAKTSPESLPKAPPLHQPGILYIGCIDARLDPIDDIGFEKGKALIFRNIAALVLKDNHVTKKLDPKAVLETGEIPQNVSIGGALEFFLNHIPAKKGQVKHIIISGHTDCGGLKACRHGKFGEHDHHLPLYLQSLQSVRSRIMGKAKTEGWDDERILHELEKESVSLSMHNLVSYPGVRKAMEDGRLEVHGWVIDTATQRILEMNHKTLEFEPMVTSHGVERGSGAAKKGAGPRTK